MMYMICVKKDSRPKVCVEMSDIITVMKIERTLH